MTDIEVDALIKSLNDDGWLLHSLSQYDSPDGIVWSATVRKRGGYRQPIGRGTSTDWYVAIRRAMENREEGEEELEVTSYMEAKVSLAQVMANLRAAAPEPTVKMRRS